MKKGFDYTTTDTERFPKQVMEIDETGKPVWREWTTVDSMKEKLRETRHWIEEAASLPWWRLIAKAIFIERARKYSVEAQELFCNHFSAE